MKARVVVNRHIIKSNSIHGKEDPVFSIQTSRGVIKADSILVRDLQGNVVGRFVYSPDKPLKCGAKAWFESDTLYLEEVNAEQIQKAS